MSEELKKKQEHLASLEDFLQSPAFLGYKAAIKFDIAATKEAILAIEPLDIRDMIEEFKLRGELRCLEQMQTIFEDARVNLKSQIDELADVEIQSATETKK